MRIDRFVEDALLEFEGWYVDSDWYGKERDCVNRFAFGFLARGVRPGAAISELGQIRIECAVPQPRGYARASAPKDLVIWRDSLATAWDMNWNPVNVPRVIMEWKTVRAAAPKEDFHDHDTEWLRRFTAKYPATFGYLVQAFHGDGERGVSWAKVARGAVCRANRRA